MYRVLILIALLTGDTAADDPVPIRREPLPGGAADLPADGVFVEMPRDDFESKVREASNAREPFRIGTAHYRASLDGDSLIGTGSWAITPPLSDETSAGSLDVGDLRLALRSAQWLDGNLALFHAEGDTGLRLFIPEGDRGRTLELAWSARGLPEPGVLRFVLGVPPTPVATLELELPPGTIPSVPHADCVLSGPTGDGRVHLWRVAFGGRKELTVNITRPGRNQPDGLIVAREPAETVIDVEPDRILCSFARNLEAPHAPLEDLVLEYSPELVIRDVVINNRSTWEVERPGRLRVRLRKPTRGGNLTVTAMAPVPAGRWKVPWLRPSGGIDQGERITLNIASGVRLADWHNGAFRIANVGKAPADGHRLDLVAGPSGSETAERPSARIHTPPPPISATVNGVWDLTAARSVLHAVVTLSTSQGVPGRVVFPLPPGWSVRRVTVGAAREPARWVAIDGGTAIRVLLPGDPPAGQSVRCDLFLKGPTPREPTQLFELPEVAPAGASDVSGRLTVRVGPDFSLTALPRGLTTTVYADSAAGLIGGSSILATRAGGESVTFRHVGPLNGVIRLSQRTRRLDVTARGRVLLTASPSRVRWDLVLRTEVATSEVWIGTTAPVGGIDWDTSDQRTPITSVEPVPIAAATAWLTVAGIGDPIRGALAAAACDRSPPRWWRVRFARPWHGTTRLTGDARFAATITPGEPLEIPLLRILSADRVATTVEVDPPVGTHVAAVGFRPPDPGRRVWTAQDSAADPSLRLVPTDPCPADGQIDSVALTTYVPDGPRLICHFRYRLVGVGWSSVPLTLPEGARLIGIAVSGRRLEDASTTTRLCLNPTLPAQFVELLYELPRPTAKTVTTLKSPVPGLPLPAPVVAREWRLPQGIAPLYRGAMLQMPEPSSAGTLWRTALDMLGESRNGFRPIPAELAPGTPTRLGDWLASHDSAMEWVIDSAALRDLGVGPSSRIGADDLPVDRLAFGPIAGRPVITSTRQGAAWSSREDDDSLDGAVTQAAEGGRDPSGRFRGLADWLESESSRPDPPRSPLTDGLAETLLGDWSVWKSWVPPGDPGELRVVNNAECRSYGWAVAILAGCAAGWFGRKRGRAKWVLLGVWLTGGAGAWLWLPEVLRPAALIPLLAGLAVAAVAVLFRSRRPPSPKQRRGRSTHTRSYRPGSSFSVRVAPLLACVTLTASAQPPRPSVVYLQGGHAFVPAELLDQLDGIVNASPRVPGGPVITAAEYDGALEDGVPRFRATYTVTSPRPSRFDVPLTGVRLRELLLNGEAAHPLPLPGADAGYRIDVPSGDSQVVFHFEVTPRGSADDREARFGVPPSPLSRLRFTAPRPIDRLEVWDWSGAQSVQDVAEGRQLSADLGRSTSVRLGWRQPDATGEEDRVTVREMSLWEVGEGGNRLLSVFDYRVVPGSVPELRLNVPVELAVGRLELDVRTGPGAATRPGIKSWTIGNAHRGYRILKIELQSPLTGRALLILETFPREPLGRQSGVRLPVSWGTTEARRYAAIRFGEYPSAKVAERPSATPIDAEEFHDRQWPLSGSLPNGPPDLAFRWPEATPHPELLVTAAASGDRSEATHVLRWQLGPGYGYLSATSSWLLMEPASVVEWAVPASLRIRRVEGPNVWAWSRTDDNRVQVWLSEPSDAVNLSWDAAMADPPGRGVSRQPVSLPAIHSVANRFRAELEISCEPGWSLTEGELSGLRPEPADGQARRYVAEAADYSARFWMLAPETEAAVELSESAGVDGGSFHFEGVVTVEARDERDREFILTAEHPRGTEDAGLLKHLTPVLPAGVAAIELSERPGRRSWVVRADREVPSWQGRWVADVGLGGPAVMTLPRISLRNELTGAPIRCAKVRLSEAGLRPIESTGLLTGDDGYLVTDPEWVLRLTASPTRLNPGETARLVSADLEAAPVGDTWAGRAALGICREGGPEPLLILPDGGTLLAVRIDGAAVSIGDGKSVRLPIPDGSHTVQVVWTVDPGAAMPEMPRIDVGGTPLRADGTLRTAYLPEGWELAGEPNRLDAAERDLRRGELCQTLAGMSGSREFTDDCARWVGRARLRGDPGPRSEQSPPISDVVTPLPHERVWQGMPLSEAFAVGRPVIWTGGRPPRVSVGESVGRQAGVVMAVALLLVAGLIGLSIGTGKATRPEQFALVGGLAATLFGLDDGWIFLALPAMWLAFRLIWMVWHAARFVIRQAVAVTG